MSNLTNIQGWTTKVPIKWPTMNNLAELCQRCQKGGEAIQYYSTSHLVIQTLQHTANSAGLKIGATHLQILSEEVKCIQIMYTSLCYLPAYAVSVDES